MATKTFTTGEVLTASDTNTYLANSGLVYVASGALSSTATNFAGCFTSTFTNYKIVIDSAQVNAAADFYFRMLSGSTPQSGANYEYAFTTLNTNGTTGTAFFSGDTVGFTGLTVRGSTNTIFGGTTFDIYGPQLNQRTFVTANASSLAAGVLRSQVGMSSHNLVGVFDGIQILTASAATIGGNVTIYGYRKA
jgi:hypothetical protein